MCVIFESFVDCGIIAVRFLLLEDGKVVHGQVRSEHGMNPSVLITETLQPHQRGLFSLYVSIYCLIWIPRSAGEPFREM